MSLNTFYLKLFKQKLLITLVLFILTFIIFYSNILNIPSLYFDETHYVPAAKEWINWSPTKNLEHPPLGKYFISLGIMSFGDNPYGWRVTPLIAGIVSILLCFSIANLLFKNGLLAFNVGLLSLFNFWFFVQSRIAMLDIFMVLFVLLGFYFYLLGRELKNCKKIICLCLSAVSFGLSISVKWSALFIYLPFFTFYTYDQIKRNKFKNGTSIKVILSFGIVSLVSYYLTFMPYLFVTTSYRCSFWELLIKRQWEIYNLQKAVTLPHHYQSPWYQWPLMLRPIWYEFIKVEDGKYFKGILLLGNPFQMMLGILASLAAIFRWEKLDSSGKIILVLFLFSWLGWPMTSRKITFFYYFFPSAIFYSFLIPIAIRTYTTERQTNIILFSFVLVSIIFFIYFYPILSGQILPINSLNMFRWLDGWI